MKLKRLSPFFLILIFLGCQGNTNNEEFIEKAAGRYLYNSDEIIEVYFNESNLYLKWRGANAIKPLKVEEETFFVKEMNEKIQFLKNPTNGEDYLVLLPKNENEEIQYNYKKIAKNQKIPSEYLNNNEFVKALEGYLDIKKQDSLDASIKESNFNSMGYKELRNKNYTKAVKIFNINIALYPNSSNVYDSYAEALMKTGDTVLAVTNYKKSLKLDSGNSRAKRFIEKYDKK